MVTPSDIKVGDTASGDLGDGRSVLLRSLGKVADDEARTAWEIEALWTEEEAAKRVEAADLVVVLKGARGA